MLPKWFYHDAVVNVFVGLSFAHPGWSLGQFVLAKWGDQMGTGTRGGEEVGAYF